MEHARAVVLHLGGHEVKVPGLVVSNAHIEPPVTSSITGTVGWPEVTLALLNKVRAQLTGETCSSPSSYISGRILAQLCLDWSFNMCVKNKLPIERKENIYKVWQSSLCQA